MCTYIKQKMSFKKAAVNLQQNAATMLHLQRHRVAEGAEGPQRASSIFYGEVVQPPLYHTQLLVAMSTGARRARKEEEGGGGGSYDDVRHSHSTTLTPCILNGETCRAFACPSSARYKHDHQLL